MIRSNSSCSLDLEEIEKKLKGVSKLTQKDIKIRNFAMTFRKLHIVNIIRRRFRTLNVLREHQPQINKHNGSPCSKNYEASAQKHNRHGIILKIAQKTVNACNHIIIKIAQIERKIYTHWEVE